MSAILTRKHGSLLKRLGLFDATVSKTILWCHESWTLTMAEKSRLTAIQNAMLRQIVGLKRAPNEDWVAWVKRSTRAAKSKSQAAGVRPWVEEHLRGKWSWAGHVARMPSKRWPLKLTSWRDSRWNLGQAGQANRILRPRPGRQFRWEDEICQSAAHSGWTHWQNMRKTRNFGIPTPITLR